MVNILLGILIYFLRGEKEEIIFDIILKMVFEIKIFRRYFFWEVTCLWRWK